MLEPFNLKMVYVNEVQRNLRNSSNESINSYIEYAVSLLEEVHIVNESIVSSVNDMVTEIAIQFVKNFEGYNEVSQRGFNKKDRIRNARNAVQEILSETPPTEEIIR